MSQIKSSDDHLVLNAEGTAKDTKIQSNGTDLVTVASTGNVNINGTVTADDNIQVDSGSGSTPTIKFTSNAQTGRYSQVKVDTNRDIVLTAGVGSVNEYPKIKMFTGTPSGEQERICIDNDGLKFNGDTAAANALDDYEEGSWTPIDVSGDALSLSVVSATYTKIGDTVNLWAYVTYPSNSGAAQIAIGGLPFNVAGSSHYAISPLNHNGSVPSDSLIRANAGLTLCRGYRQNNTTVSNSAIANSICIFSLTYRTA